MRDKLAKLIEDFCDTGDYEFRGDYSGRYMYGRSCVGIVCDNPITATVELFAYILNEDEDTDIDELASILGDARSDNMGLSMIVYFPQIKMED